MERCRFKARSGDRSGVKKQLGKLVGVLKADALSGISKNDLLGQVKSLPSMEGVGKMMGKLIGGANPSILTDAFKGSKDGLMKAAETLK